MKRFAIIALITAAVLGLGACSSEDPEVILEMDQGNITKEEFYEELKAAAGDAVLHSMVYTAILEDKYEIDESIIDDEIESMKEEYGEAFEMVLYENNFGSEDDLRKNMRLGLLEHEALTDGIEITDEEIETRYERMQTEIEASHILVEDEESASELYQELLDGADFAELAIEHSIDPGTGHQGGDLGRFRAGQMIIEFEDKAYSLSVDEIGEPVESQHGWHIIKVTGIHEVEEELPPLDDFKEELRDNMVEQRLTNPVVLNRLAELFDESNINVHIDEYEDLFKFDDIVNSAGN